MKKPEFKALPCVFCSIGFNCYIAVYKLTSAALSKVTDNKIATNKTLNDVLEIPQIPDKKKPPNLVA